MSIQIRGARVVTRGNININFDPRIITSGLVLHLDAGITFSYPGTGNTWTDISGYGNNATLTNGPYYTTEGGGSIYFNGSNNYAPIGTNGFAFGGASSTISVWMKGDNVFNQYQWPITYGQASPGLARFVGTVPQNPDPGQIVFGGYAGGPGNCIDGCDLNGSANISQGIFFNLSGSFDGTTQRLYFNGQLVASKLNNMNTTAGSAQLGRQVNGGEYMKGWLAAVYNYNRALTDDEVLQNYKALRRRFGL